MKMLEIILAVPNSRNPLESTQEVFFLVHIPTCRDSSANSPSETPHRKSLLNAELEEHSCARSLNSAPTLQSFHLQQNQCGFKERNPPPPQKTLIYQSFQIFSTCHSKVRVLMTFLFRYTRQWLSHPKSAFFCFTFKGMLQQVDHSWGIQETKTV